MKTKIEIEIETKEYPKAQDCDSGNDVTKTSEEAFHKAIKEFTEEKFEEWIKENMDDMFNIERKLRWHIENTLNSGHNESNKPDGAPPTDEAVDLPI